MLSVAIFCYAYCHYPECHYGECRNGECRGAVDYGKVIFTVLTHNASLIKLCQCKFTHCFQKLDRLTTLQDIVYIN
jgi:hypothetical protein